MALAFLLLGAAAAAGGYLLAIQTIEDTLRGRGFTWERREGTIWYGLARPGVTVEALSLRFSEPGAVLWGARVQLDQLDRSRTDGASGTPGARALPSFGRVWAEELTVQWEETPLAVDLSGELWPTPQLQSADSAVQRGPEGWAVTLQRPIAHEHVTGTAELTVTGDAELDIRLSVPDAVLSHTMLAEGPLPAQPLRAALRWVRESGDLTGTVSLGEAAVSVAGTLSTDRLTADVTAAAIPLEAIVGLFGRRVPEGERADIRGTIGLEATVSGPPIEWSATVSADGLGAAGVVSMLSQLQYGTFSWRAPAPGGGVQLRETGEGHRTWTPLRDGMLMAQAAIAAEDARFRSHPGFDIEGINVALGELSQGAERPRGGSTITQQLAKNLFLSGERTIARKLRELLYALEMERELGKPRILELYINVVEFGPTTYGVRTAADTYFLKRPEGLAPQEAAFLAAILPSPRSWYARVASGGRPPGAVVDRILRNMVHTGAISDKTARWAQREPLVVIPPVP